MAKQLDLLEAGKIIPIALHSEMERSYLEYAMSVIVGRALPDVRDGLKPVHRRIIYAMHELGLTPDRPYRKCARVVGDVLGKYHPHGDQSVYDALVRMVQTFSSRYPLLAGHGNFGSVDNDPPAAMRYTETRLAPVAHDAMLADISEATIDYANNFDNSQQEPCVLPAQLPLLLLNGCSGIAVGMATNVPPHNLGEVVDGLIALIDRPDLSDAKLWEIIPGPDFPTGGEIVDRNGIEDAYRTGRGSIPMRGVAHLETIQVGTKRRRNKQVLVITELPYQVNKAAWIEKIADLVNQNHLDGISDIRDESDRDGMRVVIELKRDGNPQELLRQLYKKTPLQSNFGAIFLTLVNNKPCQLSLREVLTEFLNFREITLTRRYRNELDTAQTRLHLVGGLLTALNNLDQLVEILRHAPDGTTAKGTLQTTFDLSERQADSILAMPMRRLTGLERQKLEQEVQALQTQIEQLERLLGDRHELLKSLKKDLRALKRKFGDPRRTRILSTTPTAPSPPSSLGQSSPAPKPKATKTPITLEPLAPAPLSPRLPADAVLEVTHKGGICWQSPPTPPKRPRKLEDLLVLRAGIGTRSRLLVLTASGKVYPVAMSDIPSSGSPTAVIQLMPSSVQQKRDPLTHYLLPPEDLSSHDLVVLTQQGRIKRLAGPEFEELTNRGAVLLKLKDEDQVQLAQWAKPGQELAIATSGGRILRCPIDDQQIPVMGRTAQGNQATRTRQGEAILGGAIVEADHDLILVTRQGYAKRLGVAELRLGERGNIGTQALRFHPQDQLVALVATANPTGQVGLLTSEDRLFWLNLTSVEPQDKEAMGRRLKALPPHEMIRGAIGSIVYGSN